MGIRYGVCGICVYIEYLHGVCDIGMFYGVNCMGYRQYDISVIPEVAYLIHRGMDDRKS